jgi:cytoskeletal protein CcmA (bactofilin family)
MWNKTQGDVPGTTSPSQEAKIPGVPSSSPSVVRTSTVGARSLACLGASLTIKGEITGDEDLQIDGKVEGAISLNNHRLTVGRGAQLNSEISARELVVYGKAVGDLVVRDRVEIKKDGEVIGDITTSRISIEDGAYFKGHIEIERGKQSARAEQQESTEVPLATAN